MKDLDALLKETLNDQRWSLRPGPGTFDAVETAARRLRRRRRAGAVAGTMATVMAIALVVAVVRTPGDRVQPPPAAFGVVDTAISLPGGGKIDDLLAGGSSLYAISGGQVHRIDRGSPQVAASSPQLPLQAGGLLTAGATIWVVQDTAGGNGAPPLKLYGLDPVTLARTSTVTTDSDESGWLAAGDAIWSASTADPPELVERDLTTGAVTRRIECDCAATLEAVDEENDVAWLWSGGDDYEVSLTSVRLSTGETRGRRRLGTGLPLFALGLNGSLWAALTGRDAQERIHLNPEARPLDDQGFTEATPRLDSSSTLDVVASRMLLRTPGKLTCLDRDNGTPLSTYQVTGTTQTPVAGTPHTLYAAHNNQIISITGPDPCLT